MARIDRHCGARVAERLILPPSVIAAYGGEPPTDYGSDARIADELANNSVATAGPCRIRRKKLQP